MSVFNPLNDLVSESSEPTQSTSSLINDVMGMCPKCKKPFGSALVNNDNIYYCESCRVSQPAPV